MIIKQYKTFKKDANEAFPIIIQTQLKHIQASGPMFPEARWVPCLTLRDINYQAIVFHLCWLSIVSSCAFQPLVLFALSDRPVPTLTPSSQCLSSPEINQAVFRLVAYLHPIFSEEFQSFWTNCSCFCIWVQILIPYPWSSNLLWTIIVMQSVATCFELPQFSFNWLPPISGIDLITS